MNRLGFSLLPVLLVASVCISSVRSDKSFEAAMAAIPLLESEPEEMMEKLYLMREEVIDRGCDTNLCFVLQGGDAVTDQDYLDQQNFVDIVIAIIATDDPANLGAVQYNNRFTPISNLTGNVNNYLERLYSSYRRPGGTNIQAGIRYCARVLRPQKGDANKIVLLGNGFATIGRNHIRAARRFFDERGTVCAVAVGQTNMRQLAALTQSRDRIVNIDGYFELAEIIVDVVRDVCGYYESQNV